MAKYPVTLGLIALAEAMRKLRHNAADVARSVGVGDATITNALLRRRGVGLDLATKLEDAYGEQGVKATDFSDSRVAPAGVELPEFPRGPNRVTYIPAAAEPAGPAESP